MTVGCSHQPFLPLQTRSLSGSEHHFSIHSVKIMMIIQLDTRGTLAFRINPVRARQRHLYHLEGEYGFQVNNEQLPAASVALAVLIRQGRRHGGQGEIFLPRSSFLSPPLARSLVPSETSAAAAMAAASLVPFPPLMQIGAGSPPFGACGG